MFFKKKKKDNVGRKVIPGMILLNDENSFDLTRVIDDLKEKYNSEIDDPSEDNGSATFEIEEELVTITYIPSPIPQKDIDAAAKYAYNWPTVSEDIKAHRSHILVSIAAKSPHPVDHYRMFTQVICSLLRTTNSSGVYKGNQALLIQKNNYLTEAALMDDDFLPLNLWIYFGLGSSAAGNSGYTYGLTEFGKNELEILNSKKSLDDIREFLFNMAHYLLEYDLTFRDGETCGNSEDEQIPITLSQGEFVSGESFKLAY